MVVIEQNANDLYNNATNQEIAFQGEQAVIGLIYPSLYTYCKTTYFPLDVVLVAV